ncbi:INT [Macrobrachium rosenbergii nudivirus]|nr:INT [Macrobrachium rosenbergii nudivirus]
MDTMIVDDDLYTAGLKMTQIKVGNYKLPKYIMQIIHDNNLIDIDNVNERAIIFLTSLYKRNLKGTTILKYFKALKPHLFKNTTIIPDSMAFDKKYTKDIQLRGSNLTNIENFIKYVIYDVKDVVYKYPIIIAAYTGLRINEVCAITMKHLNMLANRKPIIPIKRKNNKHWHVIYYDRLNEIIDEVINVNMENYNLYVNNLIDVKLFPYTTQALHNKIKHYYLLANTALPPLGFGLHSVRYYLASTLYQETSKIEIAQALLGHQQTKTTQLYIKPNVENLQYEMCKFSDKNTFYSNIKELINKEICQDT